MSLPDPSPSRKPSRLRLYAPFALLVVLIAGWSGFWLWTRGEAWARIDAGAQALRAAGYEVTWKDRVLGGYPFRLDVTLTDARIRDRSGWALETPRLEAEAFMHAPTHWVIAAPEGLTFVRPAGGPVQVTGKLLRGSFSHPGATPPNLSFEGVGLGFQPAAGAEPFGLAAAERVEIHVRRAPAEVGDEAGLWLSVKGGKAAASGLLGRIAGGKPIAIEWDSRLTRASDLRGPTWAEAVRRWAAAGGRILVKHGGVTAGDALLGANSGDLGVGADGRLTGTLNVSLKQAPQALAAMAQTGAVSEEQAAMAVTVAEARAQPSAPVRATLTFQAGRTTLGPVAIAPAPKIYEPR